MVFRCMLLLSWLGILANAEEPFWAFQAPQRPSAPESGKSMPASHRTDLFLNATLEAKQLAPQSESTDQAYLRRLHLVLTGLPPSAEDQADFLADDIPNKRQRLVDRLLASYGFGERLTSFWLPIARYAEDQAHEVGNNKSLTYPNAHRYRQWVIDAFNHDLPYDDFVRYQLAADLHEADAHRDALGFLGLGPKYYNRGRLEVKADEWEDRVDTVTRSFLGLTVACARCHDHKYDPISKEDYHAMAGVFASTEMLNETLPGRDPEKDKDGKTKKGAAPAHTRHIVKEGKIQDLNVFIRGDVNRKGDKVQRGFLTALSKEKPITFKEGSGRKQLADALVHPSNPLTDRVMVNRLWQEIFGRPLVSTPSNFGALGELPTHPELLDDLAIEFAQHRSIKHTIRAMLESTAFQREATAGPNLSEHDPANQWLGRMNRRKLSFEMWRDTLLTASGSLDPRGGQSLEIEDENNQRRTVYARISRLDLNDVLEQFDYPDPNIHASHRGDTTTTTQKLYLLNHPFVIEQATLLGQQAKDADDGIALLYQRLLSRLPEARERHRARNFLDSSEDRWAALTQVLICSNEMLFLD
jgi:hypothetical protein